MANEEHVSPRRRLPRTRGATSGLLLLLLGAWGALIPFVGPYFNFSFTPDKAWTWSAARGWLEVLPGAVTFLGGLLLLLSRSRATTLLGSWLAIAGGAWFIVGPSLASLLHLGSPGMPAGSSNTLRTLESLALFSLLGAVILFLAASAFGRLSVVSLRDVHAAEREERQLAEQRAADEAIREQRMAQARREEEHARLDERLKREQELSHDDDAERESAHSSHSSRNTQNAAEDADEPRHGADTDDKRGLADRLHLPGHNSSHDSSDDGRRADDGGQHVAQQQGYQVSPPQQGYQQSPPPQQGYQVSPPQQGYQQGPGNGATAADSAQPPRQ